VARPVASWWSVGDVLARVTPPAWVSAESRALAAELLDHLRGDVLVALAQHSTAEGRRRDASGQDGGARALDVGRSTVAEALRSGWLCATRGSEGQ
jgi:hypothetical protein